MNKNVQKNDSVANYVQFQKSFGVEYSQVKQGIELCENFNIQNTNEDNISYYN